METISAEVKLENAVDRGEVERGDRKESDIRRASVHASVDTTGVRAHAAAGAGRAPRAGGARGPRGTGHRPARRPQDKHGLCGGVPASR